MIDSSLPATERLASPRPNPSNVEAEQAVLGSLLLDPDAVIKVAPILKPHDFYLEKHAWIFEAIVHLHEQREPVDLLSVVSALEQRGQLNDLGGAAYLTSLMNAVPTAVHIEHYARLVERASLQRRLLRAASQIAEVAFDGESETDGLIERAERVVFEVAQNRQSREWKSIDQAVTEFYDRIRYLDEHRGELSGIQTNLTQLNLLLGGLQKSDLIVVAGRPGSGKTSFALSLAHFAAVKKKKDVAIFSLEMSAEQLAQRLVSSESGVDSHQLRLGHLDDEEWQRVVNAAGVLAESKIYIDDSPTLTPLELRAKARRLAMEHGLDLVVLDYMQLMSGSQASRSESNRVQEMSYISRQLKALARDLNVPVLALSQLSRAVEARPDKRPQLSDLRESGCLSRETPIYLPDQGIYRSIAELVGQSGFRILALNQETWRLEPAVVTRAFATGIKPVYALSTRLGRSLRATANHKFLTIEGWRRLDELEVGTRIALPRRLPSPPQATLNDAELALLGHLIGDGCTLPRHAIQYTTRERAIAETVADLAKQVFDDEIDPRISRERNWYQVYLSARQHLTHDTHNPVTAWLDALGVFGLRSFEKSVPERVFAQSENSIALFLRHLWATDGCIHLSHGKSHYVGVYYASSSRELAHNVQSLLLRLAINARLSRHAQKGKGRDQYHVTISGKAELERFIARVGALSENKTIHSAAIVDHITARTGNTNRDVLPRQVWKALAVPAMQVAGMTTREMQSRLGNAYCGTTLYKQNLSRDRAARLAQVVKSEELARLAESDTYWDEIAALVPAGETAVYDLTVEGFHNFVASDIIVHNSIEQDADIVMFIYRDKLYYQDKEAWSKAHPNKPWPENLAELSVAKHRHGPTRTLQVYFVEQQARFADLAPEPQSQ